MTILLIIFAFYLPFQLATNVAPGYDLASIRILAILIFLVWLFQSLARKKLFIPNRIQTLLIISFLFLNSLSLFFAGNLDWGFRKLLFLFSFFPLYLVFADVFQDKNNLKKIITALVYGAGLISLVGIFQFLLQFIVGLDPALNLWSKIVVPFLGTDFSQSVLTNPSWLVNISGRTIFRAIALFPDPHMFSYYLNMILPFSVVLTFNQLSKNHMHFYAYAQKCSQMENGSGKTDLLRNRISWKFLSISCLILIADLLTFSRGGYLGLLAGFIVFLFFVTNKIRLEYKFIFASILIIFIASSFFINNPVTDRLISSFNLDEGSNQGRIETWKESLDVIAANPITGVGVGNYPLAIKPSADYREPIYSHDLYFDIAAETGSITSLIFIFLIIFSIISFYKKRHLNFYAYAGIISLVAFSVHSLFETPLYSVQILPLLLLIFALSATEMSS